MSRKIKFTIGDRVVLFRVEDFNDLDLDKLLRIDYENLVAELVTFPVVVNRLGLLCADMDNEFQQAKLELSIYEAKASDKIRNGSEKKLTIAEVESALTQDKIWKVKKQKMLRIQKEKEYMYSVYSAAKDKSNKLDKLSLTIRTGDIDDKIIQRQLNNVYFKIKEGAIKGGDE